MSTPRTSRGRVLSGNTNLASQNLVASPPTTARKRSTRITPRGEGTARFTPRGHPRLTKAEAQGTVVRTRSNWDELRREAGVYDEVQPHLTRPRVFTKAQPTQRLYGPPSSRENLRRSPVPSSVGSSAALEVPPTPPSRQLGLGEMSAEEAARWMTFKICENLKDVGRAFRYYDTDQSGAIDYNEFRGFLTHRYNLFMNDYEFHKLMKQVDPDRSGEVDFNEFIDFFQKKNLDPALWGSGSGVSWQVMKKLRAQLEDTWGGVTEAFKAIDKDRSGTIDFAEFSNV